MGVVFSNERRQTQATIGLVISSVFILGQSLRFAFKAPAASYGQTVTAASLGFVSLVSVCGALSSGLTKLAVMDSVMVANIVMGSHLLAARGTPHSVRYPGIQATIAYALAFDLFLQGIRFRTSHPQQAASQLDELERRTLSTQRATTATQAA